MLTHTLLLLALLAACIGPALAADIGECATPEAMTAKLKAEDQHSIITAHRVTPERALVGWIVTMSSDRSSGYILDADRKLGERATKLCVYLRLKDIRLFDARKPGLAPGVLLKASDAEGDKQCDAWASAGTVPRGNCGPLNVALRRIEPKGHRVMLHAQIAEKESDDSYRSRGVLATITGQIGGTLADVENMKGGTLSYSSLTTGGSYINRFIFVPEYTPYGLQALQ